MMITNDCCEDPQYPKYAYTQTNPFGDRRVEPVELEAAIPEPVSTQPMTISTSGNSISAN